jgi:hypothetical protein
MTCVMTASALGGPLGRLAVGPVFEWGGLGAMFVAVAGAMSVGAVVFVAVALRVEPGDEQVVAAGVADATS